MSMNFKNKSELISKCRNFLLLTMVFTQFLFTSSYAKELVFAAADSKPTAYMENGKVTGQLVDIVNEAFLRIGHPIKIRLMPWARCLKEARLGNIDGVFSSFKLQEREAFLTFTDIPIITQVEAFFVRADSELKFDGNLTKLKNVKIGVIRGTSYGDKIDNVINDGTWKNVQKSNNIDSMIAMLVEQRFDLMPSYRHVALSAAKRAGVIDNIKELSPSVDAIPSYLAFSKKHDCSEVIKAFNKAIEEMIKDGTFDSITNKYLK